ncbi:MAG: hypothetical protein K8R58_07655 [Bacteroidales bacterium]|nr:hypothetical protein [Bacteroidales bacterium]
MNQEYFINITEKLQNSYKIIIYNGYDITFCGSFKFISLIINNLFGMMDEWNNGILEM